LTVSGIRWHSRGASLVSRSQAIRIETVLLHPYCLPLRRPWTTARGRMLVREGWLVVASCAGIRGYGDCAPLPEAGTEFPETAWHALRVWRDRLPGQSIPQALESLSGTSGHAPAAAYSMECALLDLESRLQGLPLHGLLNREATNSVPVNGALGPLDTLAESDLRQAAADGFRVLKIKVGVRDPRVELQGLRTLANSLPVGLTLRLDSNGAWDLSTATRMIGDLAGLPIECIEEPLTVPDPEALAGLQSCAGFPLALDESLPRLLADGLDLARFPVRRAVLKPAVIGGLGCTLDLAHRLRRAGIQTVVTSLVESAAGLWPTAQLAAAIGGRIPQGLATASWLTEDVGAPPLPLGGSLRLPDRPGSGFEPDPPHPLHP
jgi:o-succinylbenzoate synthase